MVDIQFKFRVERETTLVRWLVGFYSCVPKLSPAKFGLQLSLDAICERHPQLASTNGCRLRVDICHAHKRA
jgi:hypothetical protein